MYCFVELDALLDREVGVLDSHDTEGCASSEKLFFHYFKLKKAVTL
jgi:hypothetical protein